MLIYEDVASDKHRDVKFYFVQLAKAVIQKWKHLATNPVQMNIWLVI